MRKHILAVLLLCVFYTAGAQTILFVDDNDNITDNSDTMLLALAETPYTAFDVFNVATEGDVPELSQLETYDLVIWYMSTDGVNLGFWFDGDTGDEDLKTYLANGGRVWVMGSDFLYAINYVPPQSFGQGSFVYDYLGIDSYDVQSYGNDSNQGVPQMDKVDDAPGGFPDSLTWIFPTAWWVDGVSANAEAIRLYQMGPASYFLSGITSMLRFTGDGTVTTNTMTTLFDPALIETRATLVEFLTRGITYILELDQGVADEIVDPGFVIAPNPVEDVLEITLSNVLEAQYEIIDLTGKQVQKGILNGEKTQVNVSGVPSGMYLIRCREVTSRFVKN